jgi:hypothetical protein
MIPIETGDTRMTEQEPLMTGPEAFAFIGKQLHVHPNTARRYARENADLLPVTPLPGGGRRYKQTDVQALIDKIFRTTKTIP